MGLCQELPKDYVEKLGFDPEVPVFLIVDPVTIHQDWGRPDIESIPTKISLYRHIEDRTLLFHVDYDLIGATPLLMFFNAQFGGGSVEDAMIEASPLRYGLRDWWSPGIRFATG